MESEVSAPPAMATEVKTEVKTEPGIKTEALVEANDESVLERTPKKARAQTTLPFFLVVTREHPIESISSAGRELTRAAQESQETTGLPLEWRGLGQVLPEHRA